MQKEQKKYKRRALLYAVLLATDIILLFISIINGNFSNSKNFLILGIIFLLLYIFYSWKYKKSIDYDFYEQAEEDDDVGIEDYWESADYDTDRDIHENNISE